MAATLRIDTKPLTTLLPQSRAARLLLASALLFGASAVFHAFILAADGWQWSGAVSWRKPVVFSISLGSLAWAMGWIIDRLPRRPKLAAGLALTYISAAVVELFLVALQTWRGRASHFNVFESGDTTIFALMGTAVGVMSVALMGLFVWLLIERPPSPALRWASIGGMVFVIAGLGLGQWLLSLGFEFVNRVGAVPETVLYGAEGVAKFPHAIAFHGIHFFMVLAAVLGPRIAETQSAGLLRLAVLSYGAVLVFASAQTLLGLAPLTLSVPLVVLGIGGTIGVAGSFVSAVQTRRTSQAPPISVNA